MFELACGFGSSDAACAPLVCFQPLPDCPAAPLKTFETVAKLKSADRKVQPILLKALRNRIPVEVAVRTIKGLVADESLARELFEIWAKAMKTTPGQVAKNGKCEDNAPMRYRFRIGESRNTQANRVFPPKSFTPRSANTCDESWHAIGWEPPEDELVETVMLH